MSTASATPSAVPISPAELQALQTSGPVVLIDTRDADTYALGHIPGAANLRETFTFLATSTPAGLKELKDTFAAYLGAVGLPVTVTSLPPLSGDALLAAVRSVAQGPYESRPALVRMKTTSLPLTLH